MLFLLHVEGVITKMKKFTLLVIFIVAAVCFWGIAISAETGQAQVTTGKGSLNLRSQPENNATILDRIPNGSMVTVIAQGDVFWEIKYGNTQGYVMGKYLTLVLSADTAEEPLAEEALTDDTAAEESATQTGSIARVTTEVGPLNLRKQANGDATILAHIPNRSLVTVVSQGDVFWEVEYDEYHGYVMCKFLTMTDYTADVLAYRLLYRGNTGDDVVALKERLMDLGYYLAGSTMNNKYNETCVERIKMFQRQNDLNMDGIATPEVQAKLFADTAVVNAEELPKVTTSSYIVSSSSSTTVFGTDENFNWDQWMLNNPGVCPCCMGSGCSCCNFTGRI